MLFTWLPVNLPRPPDKFITQALDIAAKIPDDVIENVALNQDDPEYYTRRIVKNGVEMNSRVQYGFDLGEEWHSWVKTNIIENYDSTGGRLSYGKDTSVHGAHVDSIFSDTYTYKLYYLLDSGGPDTKTNFYQEYGHPILRRGSREHICCCNDYSKLTLIDQLQIPQKQWVLLNTNVLHDVENITGLRINLVVMFSTNDITKTLINFYKKFDK